MLGILENPNVAVVVLFLGVLAIYAEFLRPGKVLPGVLGSTAAIFSGRALLHQSGNWRGTVLGAVLIAGAIGCCALEARFQTKGVLTVCAVGLLTLGLLWFVPAPAVLPAVAIGIALVFCPLSSFLFSIAYRARRRKRATVNRPNAIT